MCKNGHRQVPELRSAVQLKRGKWEFTCLVDDLPLTAQWTKEDDPINPHNQYGISKYSEEKIGINLGKRYGIPTIGMRYSIVQGDRQSPYNLYSGALRIFVVHLLAGVPPTIYEDGNQMRDFINIKDVVAANMIVLKRKESEYQVFNIGGGKQWKIIDFYKAVQKILGKDLSPTIGGFRVGDTRHIFSDIEKIKGFGFTPRYSVWDSIKEYSTWVQTLPTFDRMIKHAKQTMHHKGVIQ